MPPLLPPSLSDFEPVEVIGGSLDAGVLFLCDHASPALPPHYGTLGLPDSAFCRHIAYDIGAANVTRALAQAFTAPAVLTTSSRLLIDTNRGADVPTLVMQLSDGAIVPGNTGVDADEIAYRRAAFWQPYRDAVAAQIDAFLAAGRVPAIVSLHSFTPVWKAMARRWHAGVLWDMDPRMPVPFLTALTREPGLVVGDNQPYDGALKGDTLYEHATACGLPNLLIEIRQDLIGDKAEQAAWAALIARLLRPILDNPACHRIAHYPSRAGGAGRQPYPRASMQNLDPQTVLELEAAAFRRLTAHLRQRSDVQNIDLMNLAGFCRNCLSNWLKDAADAASLPLSKDAARAHVYGMPYAEWRALYQLDASSTQTQAFETAQAVTQNIAK